MLEAGADRRALAPVLRVAEHAHGAVAELAEHVAGAVVAAVVDDDDLAVERELDRAHAAHDLHDRVALVEDGHDHRELADTGPRSRRQCPPSLTLPPVPVVRAGETFAEVDLGAPAEHLAWRA